MNSSQNIRNFIRNLSGLLVVLFLFGVAIFCTVKSNAAAPEELEEIPEASEINAVMSQRPMLLPKEQTEDEQEDHQPKQYSKGDIVISEMMDNNTAYLRYPGGSIFYNWIELHNTTSEKIDLSDWSLSVKGVNKAKKIGDAEIAPNGYALVFYDKDGGENGVLKLNPSERNQTLSLYDGSENLIDEQEVVETNDNNSLVFSNGETKESRYPTPKAANAKQEYDRFQSEQERTSPVLINEIVVVDTDNIYKQFKGDDWIELKNVSDKDVSLSGWTITDNPDKPRKAQLPDMVMHPGDITAFACSPIGLALNAENEVLLIYNSSGELMDWVSVKNVPYGASYGRMEGENGFFYFDHGTPNEENVNGKRRVSDSPIAANPDGLISGSSYEADFTADGEIYYELGDAVPTLVSQKWTGEKTISENCTIRAFALEENALPSPIQTFNYFFNSIHTLPIVSITTDDSDAFGYMYTFGRKDLKATGNIAFYEKGGSFSIPCELRMHGDTSLKLRKKGISIRFRPAYGAGKLEYDLYGGGVTSFSNLVLRTGQGQLSDLMRNEVACATAMEMSDHLVVARSRPCVLYVDGVYYGIFHLAEKTNEQMYADLLGVDKKNITMEEAMVPKDHELYKDIFQFAAKNDMRDPQNYAYIEDRIDLDSVIDWVILQGYFCNTDLTYGNLKYVHSDVLDTRWKLVFYDLDATLYDSSANHGILLRRNGVQCTYLTYFLADMMKNEQFKDRFLSRAAELLNGDLNAEAVVEKIDEMERILEPEIAMDLVGSGRTEKQWRGSIQTIRNFLLGGDWRQHNINAIKRQLKLSNEEIEHYFGANEA